MSVDMFTPVRPPLEGDRHEPMYNELVSDGNLYIANILTIGSEIERVKRDLSAEDLTPTELYSEYCTYARSDLVSYLGNRVEEAREVSQGRPDLFHRASMFAALVDRLVLVPLLFTYPRKNQDAREVRNLLLSEGEIYRITVSGLAGSLATMRNLPSGKPRGRMVGLVTEQTGLGVASLYPSSDIAVLPSLPLDDWRHKTDITAYFYDEKTSEPVRASRHVKTYETTCPLSEHPGLIGGIALGNHVESKSWERFQDQNDGFLTSHTLVEHLQGNGGDNNALNVVRGISRGLLNSLRTGKPFASLPSKL